MIGTGRRRHPSVAYVSARTYRVVQKRCSFGIGRPLLMRRVQVVGAEVLGDAFSARSVRCRLCPECCCVGPFLGKGKIRIVVYRHKLKFDFHSLSASGQKGARSLVLRPW
jgi:hypothetical protein